VFPLPSLTQVISGLYEEFSYLDTTRDKVKRVLFWVLKLVFTFASLLIPLFYDSPHWVIIGVYWLLATCVYIIQLVDIETFREYHEERVKKEVELREAQNEKRKSIMKKSFMALTKPHKLHEGFG
jgi:Ca2+/Na+ antiporter